MRKLFASQDIHNNNSLNISVQKQTFDLPRSTSNKNPGQIKIIFTSSQFTEYVQHEVLHQMYSKYTNPRYFFFVLYNFKLKTEVIID